MYEIVRIEVKETDESVLNIVTDVLFAYIDWHTRVMRCDAQEASSNFRVMFYAFTKANGPADQLLTSKNLDNWRWKYEDISIFITGSGSTLILYVQNCSIFSGA